MKPLIAVTCVAVLAAVGYFGWGELGRAQERERYADLVSDRGECLMEVRIYADLKTRRLDSKQVVDDCIQAGLLTATDLRSASPY